ncbi:MAG TPA: cyanophycin synthetase [Polyangiaceae bacterium]|nr:cyanophycin synthetase [Polyangiaceae bacterium]
MRIQSLRTLRGPNVWSETPAIETVVLIEPTYYLGESALRRLAEALPPGVADGLDRSSTNGSQCARILGHLARALQEESGIVGLERPVVKVGPTHSEYRVVVPHRDEAVGRLAVELAERMLLAAVDGTPIDFARTVTEIRKLDEEVRLGPSTASLARAAEARGIPVTRLTDGSLLRLGHGSRQRKVWSAETDATSAVAESIAQDKDLTKALLRALALPVPDGRPAKSADEAWKVAQEIGLPVAVKPQKGNQGKGVSVQLETEEAVRGAFAVAAQRDGLVIVERHVVGDDFRLLVVGNRLIAAARREPPTVTGDGTHTIEELVSIENQDPRRGEDHSTSLSKLKLDAIAVETLAGQGLEKTSIPARGARVLLRLNANLSTGGTATDVTDEVHPEVARVAIRAARMVGLDVAGVDVVASSVAEPLEVTGGAIVEVNAAPGLRMHLDPSSGTARPVGDAIIGSMFPPGDMARIPIVAVTGTNGKTTTVRCVAHALKAWGKRVGMTCTDGIYVEGRRIDTGDCSGPKSAKVVLGHPNVDAAVLETARGGILREGLGFDWCDVAIVTNVGEGDHLGLGGISSAEDLGRVKVVPVRRVPASGAAVLNADDPIVLAMASECRGEVILFSRSPASEGLRAHRARGGRYVTVRDLAVVLASRDGEVQVARLDQMPLTHGGRVGFQVENLLASVAAAWFLGIPVEVIRAAVTTFESDVHTVPGRFNVLTHRASTVILDYGHNSSALLALAEAVEQLPHRRRKIVYTAAGDRRDEDIRRQAEIIARSFDEIYIYEDKCTRGRPDGEILALMRRGFSTVGKKARIREEGGELAAIHAAITNLSPGDLLLCQVDQVELALGYVEKLLRGASAEPLAAATAAAVA